MGVRDVLFATGHTLSTRRKRVLIEALSTLREHYKVVAGAYQIYAG